VHKARGEIEDAHATVRMLRRFLKEQGPIAMLPVADSLAVRLGMPDVTGDYVRSRVVRVEQQLAADPWELPVLTACRLHITSGEPEQLALAGNLLGRCRAFAASVNNKRQLMQIDALLALQHEADGDHQAALALLCQAVLLGKPGGALHYFVDLGPELVPLLRDLRDQGTAPAYIERILGAYGEAEQAERSLAMDGQGKKPGALSPEAVLILGDLTAREMEILHLLGKRLTNKEIAAKLHIVPATVTKHTVKIYKKLEVDGRRQAVARALELGILPSN
ncbi:MAG: LuxR C-terminal-related transcriptional regulator, partial [Candidatus Promineifilaceae bacterium]